MAFENSPLPYLNRVYYNHYWHRKQVDLPRERLLTLTLVFPLPYQGKIIPYESTEKGRTHFIFGLGTGIAQLAARGQTFEQLSQPEEYAIGRDGHIAC